MNPFRIDLYILNKSSVVILQGSEEGSYAIDACEAICVLQEQRPPIGFVVDSAASSKKCCPETDRGLVLLATSTHNRINDGAFGSETIPIDHVLDLSR